LYVVDDVEGVTKSEKNFVKGDRSQWPRSDPIRPCYQGRETGKDEKRNPIDGLFPLVLKQWQAKKKVSSQKPTKSVVGGKRYDRDGPWCLYAATKKSLKP
jgi:hypothetical protein